MALTSGTYVHRYTVGALLGGAIVAAEGVGRATRRWSWVGTVAAVAVLLGCGLAVRSTTGDMVSRAQADQLVADLALGRSDRPVVVIDEYDYLLLRHTGRAGPLQLGTPPVVAHSPAAVDLDDRLRHPEDGPIEVVGTPRAVEDLASLEGWRVVGLGNGTYPRPIVQQVLAHVCFSREQRGRARQAVSYATLGINQLGAVYEGLLSYSGFFAGEKPSRNHASALPAQAGKVWRASPTTTSTSTGPSAKRRSPPSHAARSGWAALATCRSSSKCGSA